MSKSHTAGWTSESPTPAQLKEFFAQIETKRINRRNLQTFLRSGEANLDLKAFDKWYDVSSRLMAWEEFYWDVFGLEKDFPNLMVPKKPEGDWRLLVVAEGMTPEKLFAKCKELFPSWKYADNLGTVISDRKTTHDYAIWIRDLVNADEETSNSSANDLARRGAKGITLEERLVYELKFFKETGSHLDTVGWMFCAGSRYQNGSVPCVGWGNVLGGMIVNWCSPAGKADGLRTRVVISA